jgi:tetratricopeptide (TPR) repeat protein
MGTEASRLRTALCWNPASNIYYTGGQRRSTFGGHNRPCFVSRSERLNRKRPELPEMTWHMHCSLRYSDRDPVMKLRSVAFLITALALSTSPAFADKRDEARSQVDFGINVAQRGLWREAIYRWEKAVELDPKYAAAYNDLAIAYEHEGQLDKARKAYDKALELEPNNTQIRQNYDLFKEINDRVAQQKDKR